MFHDEGFLILIGIYPESVGFVHAIYVIVSWLLTIVFALIPLLKKWVFSLTVINRFSQSKVPDGFNSSSYGKSYSSST